MIGNSIQPVALGALLIGTDNEIVNKRHSRRYRPVHMPIPKLQNLCDEKYMWPYPLFQRSLEDEELIHASASTAQLF